MDYTPDEALSALIKVRDAFENAGVPVLLTGSTLLGIYRQKEILGYPELAFPYSDWNEDVAAKILSNLKYEVQHNETTVPFALLIFDIGKVHIEVQPIYILGDLAYKNLTEDKCLTWPKYMYAKENWGSLEFGGVKWNIPGDVENWMIHYYGTDWKVPDGNWGWGKASNIMYLKNSLSKEK